MMTNKNIHSDDDSLSSSEDIGFGAKLSQFSKNLVVVGRRNSVGRDLGDSLGQTLDADGCFRRSEFSNDNSIDYDCTYNQQYQNDVSNQVNERYQEQKQGNLYGLIRSVQHTDQFGNSPGVSSHDFDDGDDDSHFSMPRIGEGEGEEDGEGGGQRAQQ